MGKIQTEHAQTRTQQYDCKRVCTYFNVYIASKAERGIKEDSLKRRGWWVFGDQRERGLAESSGAEAVIKLERAGHQPGFPDSGFLRILELLTLVFIRKLVEEDTFTPPNRILSFLHLFIYIYANEKEGIHPFTLS